MKKVIVMLAFCLLGVSLFAQTGDVLSLQDAIALYEDDKAERNAGRVIELIKELVSKDINATNFDDYNYTSLIYASMYGYAEIVKSLIEAGANIEIKNNYGSTALFAAAGYGHIEVVKVLIKAGANIEAKNSDDGKTALVFSALCGHIEIVKFLIEKGADINAQTNKGWTALICAITATDGFTLLFTASPTKIANTLIYLSKYHSENI